ncbi:MAG: ABC-2 family transporter protein [Alphaproteobacteria bacterium]|nr:ABC-2 family transporter protein [Alphaproteobacteria bacterium]
MVAKFKSNLRYILALLKVSMKSALSLRAVYAVRTIFNISNHAIYMSIWFIIFDRVPSIGGWGIEHILLAYGIGIVTWGTVSFFALGLRRLPLQIDNGELDIYLTQPRPLLINIAMGCSQAAGPPEIIFGIIVLTIAGFMTSVSLFWLFFMVICATCVFGSMILAYGSIGFWLNGFYESSEEINFNAFIISNRPEAVFDGWLQIIILTVVPVTFMTHLPIEFLLTHKLSALFGTVFGTMACMCVSYLIFKAGLRRYESGNRFGVRG